jgi:hypothetical protein
MGAQPATGANIYEGSPLICRDSPAKSRKFSRHATENKSLFASFSSEKEDFCSFLKKRTKRLLLPGAGSKFRDLAGEYM